MMLSINAGAQNLSDFQWKNRIVILYKSDANITDVKSALEIVKNNSSGINERDIHVFVYKDNVFYTTNGKATNIKKSNWLPKSYDGYALIGKDGGIKSNSPYPFKIQQLFDLIDSMPMRKSEMKSNR
ncbi:hypothetical protein A9200_17295 [Maribacter hydrothermalis]|uniref:DUF4174 domain-containing protein n=2 Tax=Maribacter hydrothermalis TaxID=1836467 RepID=A0A1B7ZBH1_9FLAO|nr:hypothetical protein BTR34_03695 [Maribacter hydrothermalis]OBR40053.1 hypothetical protein A9200_17295 [Maribacter hydrothermalis]